MDYDHRGGELDAVEALRSAFHALDRVPLGSLTGPQEADVLRAARIVASHPAAGGLTDEQVLRLVEHVGACSDDWTSTEVASLLRATVRGLRHGDSDCVVNFFLRSREGV